MEYWIAHCDAPGNPWGPFSTKEIAEDYKSMLLRYFHGPYKIYEES